MANPEHLKLLYRGAEIWNRWRKKRGDPFTDLSNINLMNSELSEYNFLLTNFTGTNLTGARFIMGELKWAKFSKANLTKTVFTLANLSGASLVGANLNQAVFSGTIMGDTDFSHTKGLDTCRHLTPSLIDHRTLAKSGKLPLNFLRGCGLPDTLIEFIPSLLNEPIQFYSCFISYSSKNQVFADRLYADLQNKGVRCWLASEDLKIGVEIRIGIDESIRIHDKLLLILTKHSVVSDWVEQEVETALDRERREKRTVLFPIRLDDTVMKIDTGWPALIKNTRNIGDFRKWRNPEAYKKAFDRLLRDLKAEEKKP